MSRLGNRVLFLFVCAFMAVSGVSALDLSLGSGDVWIENSSEGGFNLYVKHRPDIGSIMLAESTEDPAKKLASYALRDPNYHPVNGDEKRKLNGAFLSTKGQYWLISSTVITHPKYGEVFQIFVPTIVVYGNADNRSGTMQVLDGSYFDIMTFQLPYADYSGAFKDNPFVVHVTQVPRNDVPPGKYMPDTVSAFKAIAEESKGLPLYSAGPDSFLNDLAGILDQLAKDQDVAIVVDATESMQKYVPLVREKVLEIIKTHLKAGSRVALVYFRDYFEEYLYRLYPFQSDFAQLIKPFDAYRALGGRDIPEAVNEALYAAMTELEWKSGSKTIILIGDAPPHPLARGNVTADMVKQKSQESGIKIDVLMLPE